MNRVSLLELQDCLVAATSTGENELNPVHLRTFSRIAKEHGQAVNEAVARCWDWISALSIATPISKKAKFLEREVKTVYSRILLAWKLLMYIVRKSQWAMRFITDQPRLHVLCQGILHLASLVPIHHNIWEKPKSRILATCIYNDMKNLGALITNKPLTMALEFLKRKGVSQLLQPHTTTPLQPIDKFYRFKFSIKSKYELASPLIEKCREEFGASVIRLFRSPSPFGSANTPNLLASTSSQPDVPPHSELDMDPWKVALSDASPPGWLNDEHEFDGVEFEDVVGNAPTPSETDSTTIIEEPKEALPDASNDPDPLEKYRQWNRDLDHLSKQIALVQKKLLEIEDRRNWIPSQNAEYIALLAFIDDLLDLLTMCSNANTSFITSSPSNLRDSGIIIEVSAK